MEPLSSNPDDRRWRISHDYDPATDESHMTIDGPPTPSGAVEVVPASTVPWLPGDEQPGRVPPRECIRNAQDALNRAYGQRTAPWPLIMEALDWQRRAIEQILDGGGS